MRITGERRRILVHQPCDDILAPRKRQNDCQRHRRTAQQPQHDGLSAMPAELRFLHQGGNAQRHEQTRLRLRQHGKRKNRNRNRPLSLAGIEQHQHQQKRQHGVDLPPAASGDDECRIQRKHRGNRQRYAVSEFLLRRRIANRRQSEVAGNRHHLHQCLKSDAARTHAQQIADDAQQPQHQHICRRIIAEIAFLIEIPRAAGCHSARPRAKAAHVHTVSLNRKGEDGAEDKRGSQRQDQADAGAAVIHVRPIQTAHQQKRNRQIECRRYAQQRNAPLLHRRRRGVLRLFARRGRRQVKHRFADGHRFHLLQRNVGKPSLAAVLRAVSAQTRHDRHLALSLAGSRIERQRFPLPRRVVKVCAGSVYAGEGHVRALMLLAAVFSHHARGQPVCRVLADGNRLLKPRIVGCGVFDQRGGCPVRHRHRLQIRCARARHPHAG